MEYYRNLYVETRQSFINLCEFAKSDVPGEFWKRFFMLFSLFIGIVYLIRIVMISINGKDTKYGTTSFWFILSLFTLGCGGVALRMFDMFPNRVFRRPFSNTKFLLLPTLVSYLISFGIYKEWITLNIDYSFAIFCGMVSVLAEMLIISVNPLNGRISIWAKDENEQEKIVKSCRQKTTMKRLRKSMVNKKDEFDYQIFSQDDLSSYLLISEEDRENVTRTYMKPSGEQITVVELESLVAPKICSCLAGLMILLMATTPYFPFLISIL